MKNKLIRTIISTICVAALLISDASLIKAGDLEPSIIEETETIPEEMPAEVVTEDAVESEHEHNLVYRDNMDGTHTVYCDAEGCDFEAVEEHSFDDEGICICSQTAEGSEDPVKEEEESDQHLEEDPPSEEEPSEEEVELLDDFEPEKAPEEPEEEDQQEIKAYFGAREFVATGVFPENAELVVIPVEKEDIEESIDEDFIIYEAYDISIMADDIKWEPDDDDLVNIIIKNIKFSNEDDVEEEFDYTDTTVLHIDDDDNVEAIACDVTEEDGGYHSLEFKTPGFSTFVIGGYTYNTDNALRTWNIGINGSSSVKASMFYLNTVDDSDGYELIISGTGATKDYGSGDFAPWYSEPYKSKLKSVYISEGITTLGGCSFYTNSNITTVTLPSTLTAIRDYAFCSCSGLAITSLPDSITSVGYCSFWGCSQMAITKFPDSLSTLGAYAFAYCSMMDPVSIPSGITVIPDYAFSTCYRWTIKEIPEGVTSIGDHAFDGCSRIKELTLPSTLTHIGSGAFDMLINCNKGIHLNNVTLADDHEVTLFHYNDDNEYVDTLRAGVLYNVTLTRDKKQDSVEVIIRFEDYNGSTRPDSLTVVFGAVYSSGDTLRKTINLGDMSGSAPNIHFYESVDKFYTELINIPFDPPEGYDIAVQRADTAEATVEFIFTLKTNYTVSLPAMIDNISDGGAITVAGVIPKRKVLRVRNIGDGDHMTELTNGNGSSIKIKFGSFSPGGYTGLLGYEGLQYLSRAFYGENHEGYLDFGSDAPEYSQKLLGTITSAGYYKPHDFPTDADAVNYYYHPIAYVGGIYTPHYQYLGKELTEEGGNGPISMSQEGNNGVFALDYAVDNTAENLAILGDKGTVDGSYILFKDKSMLSRLGYDAGTYTGNLVFSWSVEDNPYR